MKKPKEKQSSEDPREELESVLDEVQEKSEELAEHGREATRFGQRTADLAKATHDTIPFMLVNADFENLIGDWQLVNVQASKALDGIDKFLTVLDTGTASTASVTSTGVIHASVRPLSLPQHKRQNAIDAISNFRRVVALPDLMDDVLKLLARLGFDRGPKGEKSAIEQLNIAYQAYAA